MKVKQLISSTLCLAMLCTVPALAAGTDDVQGLPTVGEIGVEFVHKEGYSIRPASQELLEATSLDEIAEISRRNFEADVEWSSDEAIEEATALLNEYREAAYSADVPVTLASVSSTEFLAYMCMADGLSALNVLTAKSDSEDALSLAMDKYPNDAGGLQDSYRHFIWNHMMTDDLSKAKARTVACDYEWVDVLLPYAQSAYDDYIDQGYSTSQAAVKAYNYAYYMREDCYSVCAYGVQYFSAMFDDAAVRDFWNNCYGRAYADSYSYSYSTAFSVANNAGELINSDDDVTSSHINSVWSWDWYTA